MAVPKKKTSRARRNKRRSGKSIHQAELVLCAQCQKMIPPHTACPYCGNYRGKEVFDIEAREKKKKAKKKKKQQRSQA